MAVSNMTPSRSRGMSGAQDRRLNWNRIENLKFKIKLFVRSGECQQFLKSVNEEKWYCENAEYSMRSPKSQVSQNSSIMQTWTWESCIRVSGDGDSHYTEQIFTWEIFHKNICKIWKCNCWRCHRERSQPPISLEEKFVLAGHSMTTHYQHIWGFNI